MNFSLNGDEITRRKWLIKMIGYPFCIFQFCVTSGVRTQCQRNIVIMYKTSTYSHKYTPVIMQPWLGTRTTEAPGCNVSLYLYIFSPFSPHSHCGCKSQLRYQVKIISGTKWWKLLQNNNWRVIKFSPRVCEIIYQKLIWVSQEVRHSKPHKMIIVWPQGNNLHSRDNLL